MVDIAYWAVYQSFLPERETLSFRFAKMRSKLSCLNGKANTARTGMVDITYWAVYQSFLSSRRHCLRQVETLGFRFAKMRSKLPSLNSKANTARTRMGDIAYWAVCLSGGIVLYQQQEAVQKMIDWIEQDLCRESFLLDMARAVGYSPYYCSALFHQVSGSTLKSYVARRRLCRAALELSGIRGRVLDIAVKYGFSSQEAFTRAFRGAFGCTPAQYRRQPGPIPLFMGKDVFHPWQYSAMYQGGKNMSAKDLREARVRVEYIPAHKYMGIWEERAAGYGDFWQYHSCDQVCGIIESMRQESHPVVTSHTAGWWYKDGKRCYFYGFGVPEDYSGPVPKGFQLQSFPGSYYLVFYHPPFDYMEDNGEVMRRVEDLAWNYDPTKESVDSNGISTAERSGRFVWNEDQCQCYQRHYPEGIGYEVLRPVKLL